MELMDDMVPKFFVIGCDYFPFAVEYPILEFILIPWEFLVLCVGLPGPVGEGFLLWLEWFEGRCPILSHKCHVLECGHSG